jgi:ribosomal protein L7/L12
MSFLGFVGLCLVAFGCGFWLTKLLQGAPSPPAGWQNIGSTAKAAAPGHQKRPGQSPAPGMTQDALDRQISQLMAQGKQLDAIKLVREQNQWNLQEARFYVQQVARLANAEGPSPKDLPVNVQNQVDQLLFEGNKIAAIKLVRETTGWSLKTAKNHCEKNTR